MMRDLWNCLWGYVKIYCPKLIWVLLFTIVFGAFYYIIQKKKDVEKEDKKKSTLCKGLLCLTCSFIFVMTLFERSYSNDFVFELQPLASYITFFRNANSEILLQIVMNIIMYVPIGICLPVCFPKLKKVMHSVSIAFLGSLSIEIIQGTMRIGFFEMDDILNNTMGATIGVMLYKIVVKVRERWIRMRE